MTRKLLENLDMSWREDSIRYINTPSNKAKNLYFYVQEAGDFKAHVRVRRYQPLRAHLNQPFMDH